MDNRPHSTELRKVMGGSLFILIGGFITLIGYGLIAFCTFQTWPELPEVRLMVQMGGFSMPWILFGILILHHGMKLILPVRKNPASWLLIAIATEIALLLIPCLATLIWPHP